MICSILYYYKSHTFNGWRNNYYQDCLLDGTEETAIVCNILHTTGILLTKSKIDLEIQTERAGIIAHSCGFLQKTDKSRNAIN